MSEAFNRASIQAAHDNRKRVDMPNPNDRPGENGLTPLEYTAIHLRVEHPDLPRWLNEMIRKARREMLAGELAGVCLVNEGSYADAAEHAYDFADAMIEESGR